MSATPPDAPADRHQDAESFDAIIVGSGQGGNPLAESLAGAGWKTALIEREHVGGTCINVGCTPTKTMVASARVAHLARRAAEYGVQTGDVRVDVARVRDRKRRMVLDWREPKQRRLATTENLDLIFGEARFTAPRRLEVSLRDVALGGTRTLTARHVIVNTGARSARPPLPGLDDVPFLDSTSIMELDAAPDHLLVLGGGYIGLEFGQMFRRFGSRVTIVQRGPRLLSREDEDVARAVEAILRDDGIDVLLSTDAVRVSSSPTGGVTLTVRADDAERVLSGSHLLVATGRTPNTESLNLAAAGVETDRHGFIRVDDRLATTAPGVYALGDVKGGPAFTHISYHDSTVLGANLLERKDATIAGRQVPYTVFIDPHLGRVGLGEDEARAAGRRIKVAKITMDYVARATEFGEDRGLMKAIVDADTDQILGAAVLGMEGGEIMAMLQIAMLGRLPYTTLRDGVFAHPTLAESLNTLFYNVE